MGVAYVRCCQPGLDGAKAPPRASPGRRDGEATVVLGTGLSSLMVPPGDLSLSTRSSLFRRGVSFPKALVRCA